MGAYAPTPLVTKDYLKIVKEIIEPTIEALKKEVSNIEE